MKIFKTKIKGSILAAFAVLLSIAALITSCDKNDTNVVEPIVPGTTSIRLVHSSEMSISSSLDLYVDDVKVTTQAIAYPMASTYFPANSGTKKIEVRKGTAIIADTTLNVRDGHQYSVFVKELQSGIFNDNNELLQEIEIKKLIITDDNNTSVPDPGKAKVRFVNAATTGNLIRASGGTKGATFTRINEPGPYPNTEYLTYNLADIGSDFLTMRTGSVTFRGAVLSYVPVPVNPILVNMETILEAGKLYTVYLTGSPGGSLNNVIIPSTMRLNIIAVN